MKKQALKAVTTLGLVVTLAFITAATSANSGSSRSLRADIPFQFMVGNDALSAGAYTVAQVSEQGGIIMVKSTDGKAAAMRLTLAKTGSRSNNRPRLVFRKYGDNYFLAEVWDGTSEGHELLKSSRERAIASEQSKIAKADAQPEIVTVFANAE